MKDPGLYVEDILESIDLILKYTKGAAWENFLADTTMQDAVLRRIEIIGEAVKRLPVDLTTHYAEIPWNKIAGMRDVISHDYDGVSLEIVWKVVTENLVELRRVADVMLKGIDKTT